MKKTVYTAEVKIAPQDFLRLEDCKAYGYQDKTGKWEVLEIETRQAETLGQLLALGYDPDDYCSCCGPDWWWDSRTEREADVYTAPDYANIEIRHENFHLIDWAGFDIDGLVEIAPDENGGWKPVGFTTNAVKPGQEQKLVGDFIAATGFDSLAPGWSVRVTPMLFSSPADTLNAPDF